MDLNVTQPTANQQFPQGTADISVTATVINGTAMKAYAAVLHGPTKLENPWADKPAAAVEMTISGNTLSAPKVPLDPNESDFEVYVWAVPHKTRCFERSDEVDITRPV